VMETSGTGEKPRRVIKRYSNRKLYDTKDSRYVTLQQIGEMVRAGEEVQIIDNATKEDKTEKRGIADLLANFDISAILENLKAKLAEHLSFDKIVEKIKGYFGNSFLANSLIDTLKQKGADAFKSLLDRLLTTFGGNKETRSLKDIIDGIRGFFSKLGLEFQGKFAQFGEWVQAMWKDGGDHAKTKVAALKEIAREMIAHAKDVREEVAREALEYLGQYKEQLGDLYQKVKDSVKEAIKSKESEE